MADSAAFARVCECLQQGSSLERLEARGTVRLALKVSGLEAASVAPEQMSVVVAKVLPAELDSRGVEDGPALCQRVAAELASLDSDSSLQTPDAVFARLGAR